MDEEISVDKFNMSLSSTGVLTIKANLLKNDYRKIRLLIMNSYGSIEDNFYLTINDGVPPISSSSGLLDGLISYYDEF